MTECRITISDLYDKAYEKDPQRAKELRELFESSLALYDDKKLVWGL